MARYPHKLYIADAATATIGTTGDWTVATGSYSLLCDCREEPGGSGATVVMNDGSVRSFSSMIYLPTGTAVIQPGAKLYVAGEDGVTRFTGEVLRFSDDRKHCRIWA